MGNVELRDGDVLTREEAAEFLGVKPDTIRKWTYTGDIPYVRISGRLVRYLRPTLSQWLSSMEKREDKRNPGRLGRML